MERELYNKYLKEVKIMHNECPKWINNPNSWIADYICDTSQYCMALRKLSSAVYAILFSSNSFTLTDIISELHSKYNYLGFTYSAYRFVIKIIYDLFNKHIDIPLESINDDFYVSQFAFIYNNGSDTLTEEEKKLLYYKNRLLDFSKANQLVDFKNYERSSIGISYPYNSSILNSLIDGKKVYLEHWESLNLSQISRCSSCGKYFTRKFTKGTMNLATECPKCDEGKKTKHGKPIKETPIIINNFFTIKCQSCGKEIIIKNENDLNIKCDQCGNQVEIPSYPLIDINKVSQTLKNNCICKTNDTTCTKAASLLSRRAKSLEINFGLHGLYMACGFLKWKSRVNQEYKSPLLLVKINLLLDKGKGKYYIIMDQTDDDAISLNYTLQKMMNNYSREVNIELPKKREDQNYDDYIIELKLKLKEYSFTYDWTIEDTSAIGIFHYQKLQLEKDLDDNFDEYLKHPILRTLIGLDTNNKLSYSITNSKDCSVLDADSSQEEVIRASKEGQSFILQGPPGTGKSQTISNIIANAMNDGKTVLFVTEKATARNIIWDNLNQCKLYGNYKLTDFVFNTNNITSGNGKKNNNKISKESIKNFYNEKILAKSYMHNNISQTTNKKYVENQIINLYDEINKKYDQYTLREWCHRWSKYCEYKNIVFVDKGEFLLESADLNQLEYDMRNLYSLSKAFKINYKNHNLYGYKETNLSLPSLPKIYELLEVSKNLDETSKILEKNYNIKLSHNYYEWSDNSEVIKKWLSISNLGHKWLRQITTNDDNPINNLKVKINEMYDYAITRKKEHSFLINKRFFNYEDLVTENFYANDFSNNTVKQFKEYKNIIKRLSKNYRYLKNMIVESWNNVDYKNKYINYLEICENLCEIKKTHKLKIEFESKFDQDKNIFNEEANGWNTDWDLLIKELQALKQIIENDDSITAISIYQKLININNLDDKQIHDLKELNNKLNQNSLIIKILIEEAKKYYDETIINIQNLSLVGLINQMKIIDNYKDVLSKWVSLQVFLTQIGYDSNLVKIFDILMENDIFDENEAIGIIYKNYYNLKINSIISTDATYFGNFNRDNFEKILDDYKQSDLLTMTDNSSKLYNYLLEEKLKALKLINNDKIIKSVKGIAVKKILKDNWNVIKKITPCFMMSPLSVSQFLDVDLDFDLVIFDEASQIFLEDALASIVRGKQIIISGDRHQLPPCNFFKASDLNEEEDEYDDEVEAMNHSILDASLQSELKEISLKWHYRSNDETLIYFSNNKFYNNSLITFPTAKSDEELKLIHQYIPNAIYGNGKQHINSKQADQIIQLMWEEIQNENRKNFTLGVVAFNVAQAYEIEDRWLKFVESDPVVKDTVKKWEDLDVHKKDPIIFCNLDTIQGDERDTMIISTTYGVNQDGNFNLKYLGPVRLDGGKNRINVAITRAKQRMIVVTSLTSNQLKQELNRSAGVCNGGAEVLCEFLEYAESSKKHNNNLSSVSSNEFVKSICRELDKHNIYYDLGVGLSDCKIDIAIKKDENSTEYVLGIVTDNDGLNNKNVREFARLYDQVLKKKYSWNLYHIWMASWFLNNEAERTKLIDIVKQKLTI